MVQLSQNPLAQANSAIGNPPARTCINLNPALERRCSTFAARLYGSVVCRAIHRFEEAALLAYVLALARIGFMDVSKHEVYVMGAVGESWAMSDDEGWRDALRRGKTRAGRRIVITSRGMTMVR